MIPRFEIPEDSSPETEEPVASWIPVGVGIRIAAAILSMAFVVAGVGLPLWVWLTRGDDADWMTWVGVAMACSVAWHCTRHAARVANTGMAPQWVEKHHL